MAHWLLEEGQEYENCPHGVLKFKLHPRSILDIDRIIRYGTTYAQRHVEDAVRTIQSDDGRLEAYIYRFEAYGKIYPCTVAEVVQDPHSGAFRVYVDLQQSLNVLTDAALRKFLNHWEPVLLEQLAAMDLEQLRKDAKAQSLANLRSGLISAMNHLEHALSSLPTSPIA